MTTTQQRLLTRAIQQHGGTLTAFARDVLGRSRVTVWRWQRGAEMPQAVVDRLMSYLQTKE